MSVHEVTHDPPRLDRPPHDGRHWTVWLERGPPPVLAFASEGATYTVVVDFDDGLEDRWDADLQRLLDQGRG